jgi:hypothetical protein
MKCPQLFRTVFKKEKEDSDRKSRSLNRVWVIKGAEEEESGKLNCSKIKMKKER